MMSAVVLMLALHANPPRLVAPAWSTVKVEPELAAFFADHLEQQLRLNGVSVISAKDVGSLLGLERQKQLLGCSEQAESCMTELGNALGAEGTVLVSVARLGRSLHATLKLLSTASGKVLAETNAEGAGDEALLLELNGAAERLARALGVEGPAVAAARKRRQLAWVPTIPAVLFAAGGGVCLGLAKGQLDALDRELTASRTVTTTAENTARTGKTLEVLGFAGLGVGVAAGATALVLFLSGEAPAVAPAVSLGPAGQVSFGLTGVIP